MSDIKRCPRCKLVNPDSALRCDCGYDFKTATVERSLLLSKERLASSWARFAAWWIDMQIIGLSFFGVKVIIFGALFNNLISSLPTAVLYICLFLLEFFYYFLFEYYLQRTPGKFLLATCVETESGGKPTAGDILARTLFRCVPFEPLSGPGEWWHDRWSKTRVVKG